MGGVVGKGDLDLDLDLEIVVYVWYVCVVWYGMV